MTAPAATRRHLILVVEDEPFMLQLVSRMLREGGYEVVGARHGLAARELLARGAVAPSLVLTDLKMPYLSGLELGQEVSRMTPSVLVAYMSGFGTEAAALLSPDILQRCFISKPFTPDALLEMVERCLRNSP